MNESYSKIVKHKLYWKIIKGRRSSKGNRWLSHLWPNNKESKLMFVPKFAYLNYIGPGDVAGNHYHKNKKEIFCPLGNLLLVLRDLKNNKNVRIRMSNGTKQCHILYYIPSKIPHAVINKTKYFVPLIVLTNKKDLYANTFKYQVIK